MIRTTLLGSKVAGTSRSVEGIRVLALAFVWVVATAFVASETVFAADWLAPAADQTVNAAWVKNVAAQLNEEPYRDVFASAPGEPPHSAVVRYLNGAAEALQAGNKPLAQSYIDRTIGIFETGVHRGYYSQSDVHPIEKMIRTKAEAAMQGEKVVAAGQIEQRWAGYTEHNLLGLTNEANRE